jgi:hypothetical protein
MAFGTRCLAYAPPPPKYTSARSSALLHARSSKPLARLLKGDHDGDDDDGHAYEASGEGCGAEHVLHAGAVADENHENDFGDEGVGEVPATARVTGCTWRRRWSVVLWPPPGHQFIAHKADGG